MQSKRRLPDNSFPPATLKMNGRAKILCSTFPSSGQNFCSEFSIFLRQRLSPRSRQRRLQLERQVSRVPTEHWDLRISVSRKGIGIVIQPPYRRNPPVRNVAARVLLFPRSNCHLFYLLITVQSLLEIEHVHFYQLDSHYPTQHYPIHIGLQVRIKMYLSEIRNVRNGEKDGGNSVNQCQSTDTWRVHHQKSGLNEHM